MRWPLDKYWISNGYTSSHPALDLATIGGTYNDPIKAPESGRIDAVNNNASSYFGGKYIVLIGDSGHRHYMGHNNKNRVKVGQRVTEGQHIGDVGSTYGPGGTSSGPHIHYQVSKNGIEVNPATVIRPPSQPTSTSKGGTMDEKDLTAIYTRGPLALGGYKPRTRKAKEGSDVYLGKSAAFVINDHYNSKEAKDKRAALAREFKGLEDEVAKLKKQAPVTVETDADKKLQALRKAFEDAGII